MSYSNVKEELDQLGRLHQMKINTRLTALQSALELMKTHGYTTPENRATQVAAHGGKVDHVTLLAMAGDIEAYILGNLEKEAVDAIEAAKKPKPSIIPVRP